VGATVEGLEGLSGGVKPPEMSTFFKGNMLEGGLDLCFVSRLRTRPRVESRGGEEFWVVDQNKSEEQELNLSRS
jgi:hypothetical protein